MLYARLMKDEGMTIRATPGASATCPLCSAPVIAKCGEVNIWHWAHRARADCDPWGEGESEWHLKWKAKADRECCEVIMGPHRADIKNKRGVVIELQHSSLKPEKVAEREQFYKEMIWLCDARYFMDRFHMREEGEFTRFVWVNARKWMYAIRKPLFFDFDDDSVFEVHELHPNIPSTWSEVTTDRFGKVTVESDGKACHGKGQFMDVKRFLDYWIKPPAPEITWKEHVAFREQRREQGGGGLLPGF